jgi:predicted RNA binding protein YcfA (HicA-like mRNA interferase family)
MQNVETDKFQKALTKNGYQLIRQNGSHKIYEASRTIKDSISIPATKKTINGCMAKRLTKQMENFLSR